HLAPSSSPFLLSGRRLRSTGRYVADNLLGVSADSGNEARSARGPPGQAHEVEPSRGSDAGLVNRVSLLVEVGVEDPTQVHAVTRRPYDRRDPGALEVKFAGGCARFRRGDRAHVLRRLDAVDSDERVDASLE